MGKDQEHTLKPNRIILIIVFLSVTFYLSAYIRTVNLPSLHGHLFLGVDPVRYVRQAKIIVKEGKLPPKDDMRSVPLGKETRKQLTLFPYILAYLYRGIKFFYPHITVEKFAIICPVIFCILALLVLFMIVQKLFNLYVALLSVNIAAISPPVVGRTLAGFADKDGLVLLLSLLSFYLYINSFQAQQKRKRLIFALTFGIIMGMLGLTWQGVGIFLSVTVITDFIILLLDEYDIHDFVVALCRYIPILFLLTIPKAVYYDLSQPFVILALGLPSFLLLLSFLYIVIKRSRLASLFFSMRNRVPIVLSLLLVMTALINACLYLSSSYDKILILWQNFISPFGSNRLAQSIQELQKQGATGWAFWPGAFFLVSCVGALLAYKDFISRLKGDILMNLFLFEILLMGVAFSRILSGSQNETKLTISIYIGSLIIFLIGTLALYLKAIKRGKNRTYGYTVHKIFLIVWFILMLLIARGAVRFQSMFAIPAAILGAYAIITLSTFLSKKLTFNISFAILLSILLCELYTIYHKNIESNLLNIVYFSLMLISTIVILSLIFKALTLVRFAGMSILIVYMIFTTSAAPTAWLGSYTEKSYKLSEQKPFITPSLEKALQWTKMNLPSDTTIAAWWEYGGWINLLAEKSTIIEEEQCPYWLYLMARHVFLGKEEVEALEFLRSHSATHLMITSRDIGLLPTISSLGSNQDLDRHTGILYFGTINETIRTDSQKIIYRYLMADAVKAPTQETFHVNGKSYPPGSCQISSIYILQDDLKNPEIAVLVEIDNGSQVFRVRPQKIYFKGKCITQNEPVYPCTVLIDASKSNHPTDWRIVYLSSKARQSLIVKLFLLNMKSQFFLPVYPDSNCSDISSYNVRIWEIRYPKDLKPNAKYIKKQFPKSDLYKSWMTGGD